MNAAFLLFHNHAFVCKLNVSLFHVTKAVYKAEHTIHTLNHPSPLPFLDEVMPHMPSTINIRSNVLLRSTGLTKGSSMR